MLNQSVHARHSHKMLLFGRQTRCGNAAMLVQHAHRVGAPRLVQAGGGGGESFEEAIITHSEVLRAVVKCAEIATARAHATASAMAFFEDGDLVSGLHQRAGAGNACNACAYNGKVLYAWFAGRF